MARRCPKILTRVVLRETTVRSAHYHVLAAPGEFLDVGTMVGQGNRSPVKALFAILHMIEAVEVLVSLGQLKFMSN